MNGLPRASHECPYMQCFMQRPVQPSYGRVKQNVDGCLFVWTDQDG